MMLGGERGLGFFNDNAALNAYFGSMCNCRWVSFFCRDIRFGTPGSSISKPAWRVVRFFLSPLEIFQIMS